MSTIAAVIGRIFLALIFLVSGIGKLMHVSATEAQITAVGLPSGLAIPTGVFELLAGLCLVFGLMTRLVSALLAGFIALTILFFHSNFTDPVQQVMALKNVAMIGGMLMVFAHGQMWWSWDRMRADRRGEIIARRAELDTRDADLRAARAEGVAEAARVVPPTTVPTTAVVERPIVNDPAITEVGSDGVPIVRRRRWF